MVCARRIAVFLPNWVGDVVMATPALRALRERFADARITHVGRPAALATLGGTEDADEAVADGGDLCGLAARLRRRRLDLAVLLPNSFRTALAARLGAARRIAGYDRDARGWLLTDRLAPARGPDGRYLPVPARDYYARLVETLGAPVSARELSVPVRGEDLAAADAMLAEAGGDPHSPLVVLNPGASFGTSKMWDASRYAALAEMLIERRHARIVLNAAPSERRVASWVAAEMRHAPAINFAERTNTLGLLKALLARSDLLVTNDTGARHLGAAVGVGVVTVFGSTDPQWSRIDYPRERIVRAAVPCSPCQRKVCLQPAGPSYHQCLQRVSAESVYAAAAELLDQPKPRGKAKRS